MNGIVINIDPVALHLGDFALRWYGLAILVAIVAAVAVARYEGKRKGIDENHVYNVALLGVLLGVLLARLFHVVDKLGYYLAHPDMILAFNQGGLAIWGGVAGGFLAGVIYSRMKHLPLARLADMAAPALLVGQIIGRFGCIVNGDAYGGPTGLPWGFVYINPDAMIPSSLWGIATHPYPVYDMLWNIFTLGLLWWLRSRLIRDGQLFTLYIMFYSVGRFLLTFVRQEDVWFWGLQEAQVMSLLGLAIAAAAWVYLGRRRKQTMAAQGVSEPT